METFKVLRKHLGDKMYIPGDPETGVREANAADVEHLVHNGVLAPMKGKAEPTLANKAEPPVANKAVIRKSRKGK